MMNYEKIAEEWFYARILPELKRATKKFGGFASPHEGYAVILEETNELWAEIKGKCQKPKLIEESVQTAAMAIRFLIDICSQDGPITEEEDENDNG
jgi:hypothetical protein